MYEVSCGAIKLANKKFTSITNDYCIQFNDSTEFKEVKEDAAISKDAYAFKSIETVGQL